MRLLKSEIQKIQDILTKNLKDLPYKVYLFGSRTDDYKRGGDIDLLLLVSSENFEKAYSQKSLLKFDLEDALGDQRVDLTLATEQRIKEDEFLSSITFSMIELL